MTKDQEAISLLCDATEELIRGTIDLRNVFADVCEMINNNLDALQNIEEIKVLMERVLDASNAFVLKRDEAQEALNKVRNDRTTS